MKSASSASSSSSASQLRNSFMDFSVCRS